MASIEKISSKLAEAEKLEDRVKELREEAVEEFDQHVKEHSPDDAAVETRFEELGGQIISDVHLPPIFEHGDFELSNDHSFRGSPASYIIGPQGTVSGRDRKMNIRKIVERMEEFQDGAPVEDDVIRRASIELGLTPKKSHKEIEQLKRKGELYTPEEGTLRTT